MLGSRAFGALMRRNLIYRRRNLVGTFLEFALPVGFVAILVAIKASLVDNENFSARTIAASYPSFTVMPYSFGDYVKALQAKRVCIKGQTIEDVEAIVGELPDFVKDYVPQEFLDSYFGSSFRISGMNNNGLNWQVPFLKCDSRLCDELGQNASELCEYWALGVAPRTADDVVGRQQADDFVSYVYSRYPQLNNTDPDNTLPFDFDFVQQFDSDKDMERYIKNKNYKSNDIPKIALGIIFDGNSDPSSNYNYRIRVNSTGFNAPEEDGRPTSLTTPPTYSKFERYARDDSSSCQLERGTPDIGLNASSCTNQYMYNGALVLQRLVGDWIMVREGAKDQGYYVSEHGVQYAPFPSFEYEANGFYGAIGDYASLLITLGLLYPVASMVRYIVLEKELRQKELMKMMSVTESDIGWSWFLTFWIFHLFTAVATAITFSALYENSSFQYIMVYWIFTFTAITTFCMTIATFFYKSTKAALVGLLIFFSGYFLTQIAAFDRGSIGTISLISLHPVAVFSYGIQEIGRLEDAGIGLQASSVGDTDNASGYTFNNTIQSLVFDCIFWGIVTWYLNRVIAMDLGQPLPWYFPFTIKYWFPGSGRRRPQQNAEDNHDSRAFGDETDRSSGDMMRGGAIPAEQVSRAFKLQAKQNKSIEICGLRKTFGEKTAVDGLCMSLYRDQITALLGHNGAGKTTTISMLTGMIAPTEGYATVGGKDIRTDMPSIRQEIGICLQHDCLFPLLTVREHIRFFARVKGMYAKLPRQEVEEQIDRSIQDVALHEKRDTYSKNLSGGMKRKLSVAIAFCGDSKTVLLDEPTSGMDPFSRRFTWDVIRQYRRDRCIILTTHFMDEADILGDRIAIMAEGQLRCIGSSLFLKKTYGVGYQLTIEKKPIDVMESKNEAIDEGLTTIVKQAVPQATLLSNVGTEMSFQLPIGAASTFRDIFDGLDESVDNGSIVTYGVGITTLDEVFLLVARGEKADQANPDLPALTSRRDVDADLQSGMGGDTERHANVAARANADGNHSENGTTSPASDDGGAGDASGENIDNAEGREDAESSRDRNELNQSVRSRIDFGQKGLFGTHVSALIQKRALNFKRDKKAWMCTTILPTLFVLIGLILNKYVIITPELVALELTLEDYNGGEPMDRRNPIPFNSPDTEYSCQNTRCADPVPVVQLNETGELYSFCGVTALLPDNPSCTISRSMSVVNRINQSGSFGVSQNVSGTDEVSSELFVSAANYSASQYGAIYFTHDQDSVFNFSGLDIPYALGAPVACIAQSTGQDYVNFPDCLNYGGIGYTIRYNFTALHVAPLYQSLADEAIVREALDDDSFKIRTTIHPLPRTLIEENFVAANNSFVLWFLVTLSFPFIAGSYATFVVAERESKAKHLQTVAGVKPPAYWISTWLWDVANYQFPLWLTVILLYVFDAQVFTTTNRGVVGGVISLLVLYGPAVASFAYIVSFLFSSPSLCNLVLIISGFLVGLGGTLATFIMRLIGEDISNPDENLVTAAVAVEWTLRLFPPFNLSKGLFSAMNVDIIEILEGEDITVWDGRILLFEVLFLAWESVVYLFIAMKIDEWSANPDAVIMFQKFLDIVLLRPLLCPIRQHSELRASIPDDSDVIAEQERIRSGDANSDMIVIDRLSKVYGNGKVAVNNISLGIPPGQCFSLLGINGAGKTTTMGMLTAEFPPSSGDATLAGFSVSREPEKTRRRVGYCPQFDAHFTNMTGKEHVELYASIKGIPTKLVREASAAKLAEVGLSEFDSNRISMGYSGGMKRRLSLACATIGQPQIVFLDECSTGVDPVARREIWQMVSDMVNDRSVAPQDRTSVILTTHSMEEAEALCPRIAIMAGGKIRCLGSAQHLKDKFGQGYQVEMKIKSTEKYDTDYLAHLRAIEQSCGVQLSGDAKPHEDRGAETTSDLSNDDDAVVGGTDANPEAEAAELVADEGDAMQEMYLSLEQMQEALRAASGDEYLVSIIDGTNPNGYAVHKAASSQIGIEIHEVALFVTTELRMREMHDFIASSFAASVMRERQDTKARYEVSSEGVRISNVFQSIEDNKDRLKVAEYGVSQTSLEQVFNMHAAEAEKLKHGTNDG